MSAILVRYRRALEQADIHAAPESPEEETQASGAQAQRPPLETSQAIDEGDIGAVLIYSQVLEAAVWLVRDANALADIAGEAAGRAVFFFDEIEELRGKTVAELRTIAWVKHVFGPDARVLQ